MRPGSTLGGNSAYDQDLALPVLGLSGRLLVLDPLEEELEC
jgi:hypothetical protein